MTRSTTYTPHRPPGPKPARPSALRLVRHAPQFPDRKFSPKDPRALCGKSVLLLIDPRSDTPTLVPLFCGRWDCPVCGPRRIAKIIARAHAGRPQRIIVLTIRPDTTRSLPDSIRYIRDRLRVLLQRIRRTYGPLEYLSVLELQRNGSPHLHILQRGPYIPQRWLSATWQALTGAHKVWIEAVEKRAGAVRETTKYMLKTTAQLQAYCPRVPIVTMSKGWLPDDYNQTPPAKDPYRACVRLHLSWADALDVINTLGAETSAPKGTPWRRQVSMRSPPTTQAVQSLIDHPDPDRSSFAALLLWACRPDLRAGRSLDHFLWRVAGTENALRYDRQLIHATDPPARLTRAGYSLQDKAQLCPASPAAPQQSSSTLPPQIQALRSLPTT